MVDQIRYFDAIYMNDFPENCLRGIQKLSYILDGEVASDVFFPYEKTAENRADKAQETSINWEDDESAIKRTLRDYPNGAVRLARSELDRVNGQQRASNDIAYERAPRPNNSYHGNILFHSHLPKRRIRSISAYLACVCSGMIKSEQS